MVKRITTKVLDGRTKSLSRKFNQLSKIITDEMDDMGSFELLTKYYIKPTFWIDCSIKCCITYFTTYLISRLIGNGFKAISETINSNPIPKKNSDNEYEIGFFDIIPTEEGSKMFEKQKTFFQWHNEGFKVPNDCCILAKGKKFNQQAFKYKNTFGLQFHPVVNFKLHILWIYYTLLSNPHKLKDKGTQNILKQLTKRIKNNHNIKIWLDNFLDNYLLKEKV